MVGRGGEASLTRIEAGTVRVRACVAVTVAVRVIVTVAVVGKRLSARLSVGRGGGMRGCGVCILVRLMLRRVVCLLW